MKQIKNMPMQLRRRMNARGFTLVELALVLAVFAIIVAGAIVVFGDATHNQQVNRLHQQIITVLENTRNYARQVDNSTVNLQMADICSLNLLPSDITNATWGGSCPSLDTYMDVFNQPITVCAAGGSNVTACGVSGQHNTIAVVIENISSADCVSLISKLGADPTNLGFNQYVVGTTVKSTNVSSNLEPATLAGTDLCGGVSTVSNTAQQLGTNGASNPDSVELDFSL